MTSFKVTAGERIMPGSMVYIDALTGLSRTGVNAGGPAWVLPAVASPDVIHYRLGTEPPDCIPAQAAPTTPIATVATGQTRDDVRRGIDLLLTEDARRTPAFATARRAAVLAGYEDEPNMGTLFAFMLLARCHKYEAARGGMRKPAQAARDILNRWLFKPGHLAAFVAYELARGMP